MESNGAFRRMGWPKALFDRQRRLLFVHVPKSGGTSVLRAVFLSLVKAPNSTKDALTPIVRADEALSKCTLATWPRQENYAHATEAYSLAAIRECLRDADPVVTFALVRNPMELRLSAWSWLIAGNQVRSSALSLNYTRNFSSYLLSGDYQRLPANHGPWVSPFGYTQRSFLGPCTVLFAKERFEALWSWLQGFYPALKPVHYNRDHLPSAQRATEAIVTPEAREIVERVYADDWELWRSVMARPDGRLVPACAQRLLEGGRLAQRSPVRAGS